MGNPKIYIDELILLKIISETKEGISSQKINSALEKFGIVLKNVNVMYKKIEKLRKFGLIQSCRSNKIPPISEHKITKNGILLTEDFDKKYCPEKNRIKIIEKKVIKYKEQKELEPDEIAELTQSVVYSLLDAMEKDYEEISREKALKLEKIAEKIVRKVRKY